MMVVGVSAFAEGSVRYHYVCACRNIWPGPDVETIETMVWGKVVSRTKTIIMDGQRLSEHEATQAFRTALGAWRDSGRSVDDFTVDAHAEYALKIKVDAALKGHVDGDTLALVMEDEWPISGMPETVLYTQQFLWVKSAEDDSDEWGAYELPTDSVLFRREGLYDLLKPLYQWPADKKPELSEKKATRIASRWALTQQPGVELKQMHLWMPHTDDSVGRYMFQFKSKTSDILVTVTMDGDVWWRDYTEYSGGMHGAPVPIGQRISNAISTIKRKTGFTPEADDLLDW
jgi:hypothetical protein